MKDTIRSELYAAQAAFHRQLDNLSDEALHKPSTNPAWTNKQILFHMALGFFLILTLIPLVRLFARLPRPFSKTFALLLNASTVPFNWVNAVGARIGGKIFTKPSLRTTLDLAIGWTIRTLDTIPEQELRRGMYFPHKWDPLFQDYMTLEDVFLFPTIHFKSHLRQILA